MPPFHLWSSDTTRADDLSTGQRAIRPVPGRRRNRAMTLPKLPNLARAAVALAAMLLASQSAPAATAAGPTALALAALVAFNSPDLRPQEKHVLARLLAGDT